MTSFINKFYFFQSMKRGLLIISFLALLVIFTGCNTPVPEVTGENAGTDEELAAGNTVAITAEGFSPKTLTVKAGTMVTFVNEDVNEHWPASAMHPTHMVYPGSGIQKCGTGEAIFDACKGLAQGESFSFTFDEIGSWKYHDHLNVPLTGTIVVE